MSLVAMPISFNTHCCIAGGGPAGIMLGLLLARAGVDVVVLEKHADFLRDFRGDTVHPSTLEVIHELGLLDAFLARPHDKARALQVTVGGIKLKVADFSRVRATCRFIAMVPQWEFLDFLRDEAERHPNFRLVMNVEVTGLVQRDGKIVGVRADTSNGPLQVTADLVTAADGRRSVVRAAAGLPVRNLGAPIDVLWMRLPMAPGDPTESGGYIGAGHFLATIHRGKYWQCAYVIAKGGIEQLHARGLDAFREENRLLVPILSGQRSRSLTVPWPLKLLNRWPLLRALPAYAVGIGVRPEHVRLPGRRLDDVYPKLG